MGGSSVTDLLVGLRHSIQESQLGRPRFHGIYRGICTNNVDPEQFNRIKALVPAVFGDDSTESDWAWPCFHAVQQSTTPQQRALPIPGQIVWLMFENGNPDNPVWIGVGS
jgi:type VI secretion system (T6SS) baseplate-like injector VgrG